MLDAQVVVVGAGPAGALLAWLLSSRGVDTLLVERQTNFEREFRGEVLMPGGLAMLAAAGLSLDGIAHQNPRRFRLYHARAARLDVRVPRSQLRAAPKTVSQPQLLEALVARAERTGRFALLRGATLRDFTHSESGLALSESGLCTLRVHTREGHRRLRAQLVVGADGRASTMRRKISARVRAHGVPLDVVWCKLPFPPFFEAGEARAYLGGGNLLLALPAPDGLLQLAWMILKGGYGSLRARGIAAWVRAMAEQTEREFAAYLRAKQDEFSRPALLAAAADCVQGWSSAGALLIGDAAHTMSPVGAQGLNVAMRDAVVAANHLVPALRAGAPLAPVTARVEAERRPEIAALQRLAEWPPRVAMGRGFRHGVARAGVVRFAASAPGQVLARRVLRKFLHGVTRVELKV